MVMSELVSSRAEVEVSTKASRRRFTADYKKKILDEVERCTGSGEVGALLRREGLYSSNLARWRETIARGGLRALKPQKRGPKPMRDARDVKLATLERDNVRLRKRAERAEALVELQKKVSELLGIQLPDPDEKNS